jgi:hypothetical protein
MKKIITGKVKVINRRVSGLSSGLENSVSKDNWPFSLTAPMPPFAFGKVIALCPDEQTANLIANCLNHFVDEYL